MSARERGGATVGSAWLDVAAVVAAAEAVALVLWLLPSAVRIVEWPASGPVRMALVASQTRLAILSAGALAAAVLVVWRWGKVDGPRLRTRVLPLCLLWLWIVPYLPWIPDRLPLLLVLDGPLRWVILTVAIAGVVRARRPGWPFRGGVTSWRPGRSLVFGASLAAYLLFGSLSARALGPGGDEPHYLVITHSLLTDGDLQIENNHLEEDYRQFYNAELRPDYLTRGKNGAIYSIHAPGLPALLLPAYALAGYAGALVFLCIIAALTALAVYDLASAVAGPRAALITWAAVSFTVPFIPHAWLLFPEMPGALIVAWGALWLWQAAGGSGLQTSGSGALHAGAARWFWRGTAMALLPWLHTKFIVFLAIFVVGLLGRLRHQRRLAAAFTLPIALSLAAWFVSFYVIYGTINPEAPYGDYTRLYVINENIPRGLLGLVFDQKFGLLVYAPLYLFAMAGGCHLLRESRARYFGVLLVLITGAFIGSTARLYMWWGGSSAPARFLVPVLPCLAPMVAIGVARASGVVGRGLLGVWLAIGLGVALVGSLWPSELYLFSHPRGYGRLAELIQAGAPLTATLPTFTNEDWITPLRALWPWVVAVILAMVVMRAAAARVGRDALAAAIVGCLTFLLTAAILTARPDAAGREAAAERGGLDLVWIYDSPRHRPFALREMRWASIADFLSVTRTVAREAPAGPMPLPPGRYEARVWFGGKVPREGEILVSASPTLVFARASGPLTNPAVVPFRLPVESGRVSVIVPDEGLATGVTQIEIVPIDIVPVRSRPAMPIHAVESIPSRPDAYLVYTDEHAYPEGGVFWTRGTGATTVMVAPAGASRLSLTLHLGPMAGHVAISVAGQDYSTTVNANDIAIVEVPLPEGVDFVPVTIASPVFFRPAETDPASNDIRGLGCQVRVELG